MNIFDDPTLGCILFVIFLIFNCIFYSFHAALNHANEAEIERNALQGDEKALLIQRMLTNPRDYLNTMHLNVAVLGIVAGLFTVKNVWLKLCANAGLDVMADWALALLILVATLVVCLALFLGVGIMAPTQISTHRADKTVYKMVSIVNVCVIILLPITRLIQLFANVLISICGIDPNKMDDDVTEDEIIDLVDEAHEQGVILESEAEMIQNIMEFSDKDAKDIMTHRKNIFALEDTLTLEEAISYMTEKYNSRYPVYHEDINNIIGFIHIKDAIVHMMSKKYENCTLAQIPELIRTIAIIPETMSIEALFQSMQVKKVHMAIVVDEYGQTAGLITLEDILEEIVGNILDEYDENNEFIQQQVDQSILIDGLTPIKDVEEVLGIEFGDTVYETLNGYLTSVLGHIPTNDDKEVITNGYCFEILNVEHHVLQKLRVEKVKATEEIKTN